MNNLFRNLPPVVKNLLIINIVCYIGSLIFSQAPRFFGVFYPDSPFFQIWQPITYMFMHDNTSLGHIFFNMFSLVMFGPIVERVMGSKRFLNYYIICGLGALVLQFGVQAIEVYQITGTVFGHHFIEFDMFMNQAIPTTDQMTAEQYYTLKSIYWTPLVGASGAIFGILLAFAVLFPNMELMLLFIPVPIKAKYFIPVMILIEVYLGFSRAGAGSSIAHLAHVGGALFGFLLLQFWGIRRRSGH